MFSIYAPEERKQKPEREEFNELFQREVDNNPSKQQILVLGDLNVRFGNYVIPGIKQRFNVTKYNSNVELLVHFSINNNLRINNTFFDHKTQYKYTW